MEFYSLRASGDNNGVYETYYDFDDFYGIFSTIEKAKEYAEKLMEQTRKNTMEEDWDEDRDEDTPISYHETFKIVEDWHEYGEDIIKEITYGEGFPTDKWNATYSISKVAVDPEFKEV